MPESESESDGEDEVSSPAQAPPKVRTGSGRVLHCGATRQYVLNPEHSPYDATDMSREVGWITWSVISAWALSGIWGDAKPGDHGLPRART